MTKAPPTPPAARSPKAPRQAASSIKTTTKTDSVPENLRELGQPGNVKQNTTHKGYQQDR